MYPVEVKLVSRKLRNISCSLFLVLFTIALLVSFTNGCSYAKDLTTLSREQAIGDLDFLVENLKAIHPDPFRRISEEEFDAQVQKAKAKLGDTLRRKELSLPVSRLLALIHDDHTRYQYLYSLDFATS